MGDDRGEKQRRERWARQRRQDAVRGPRSGRAADHGEQRRECDREPAGP